MYSIFSLISNIFILSVSLFKILLENRRLLDWYHIGTDTPNRNWYWVYRIESYWLLLLVAWLSG